MDFQKIICRNGSIQKGNAARNAVRVWIWRENGAGKSTPMSVLFGLYQPEKGQIKMNGKAVSVQNPNDANELGIGMVHQHFKLVHNFTVLESIILGRETLKNGFLKMDEARKKVMELILIFDEPTAVLTPQEIDELMKVMRQLVAEGKSIIFITHKFQRQRGWLWIPGNCSVDFWTMESQKNLWCSSFFGIMTTLSSTYSGIPFLKDLPLPDGLYKRIPCVATLVVLAFLSKNSQAPKAEGILYDKGSR